MQEISLKHPSHSQDLSVGLQPEDLGERLRSTGVDEVGALRAAEELPVLAPDGGQPVDWNEAFVPLPPVGGATEKRMVYGLHPQRYPFIRLEKHFH